ncbi:hypothetical protein M0802_011546 [Mischocyttarus mexicanus]|nr:hypothetical protein M0802_011546 [Mischocyttarus mexicanus]
MTFNRNAGLRSSDGRAFDRHAKGSGFKSRPRICWSEILLFSYTWCCESLKVLPESVTIVPSKFFCEE